MIPSFTQIKESLSKPSSKIEGKHTAKENPLQPFQKEIRDQITNTRGNILLITPPLPGPISLAHTIIDNFQTDERRIGMLSNSDISLYSFYNGVSDSIKQRILEARYDSVFILGMPLNNRKLEASRQKLSEIGKIADTTSIHWKAFDTDVPNVNLVETANFLESIRLFSNDPLPETSIIAAGAIGDSSIAEQWNDEYDLAAKGLLVSLRGNLLPTIDAIIDAFSQKESDKNDTDTPTWVIIKRVIIQSLKDFFGEKWVSQSIANKISNDLQSYQKELSNIATPNWPIEYQKGLITKKLFPIVRKIMSQAYALETFKHLSDKNLNWFKQMGEKFPKRTKENINESTTVIKKDNCAFINGMEILPDFDIYKQIDDAIHCCDATYGVTVAGPLFDNNPQLKKYVYKISILKSWLETEGKTVADVLKENNCGHLIKEKGAYSQNPQFMGSDNSISITLEADNEQHMAIIPQIVACFGKITGDNVEYNTSENIRNNIFLAGITRDHSTRRIITKHILSTENERDFFIGINALHQMGDIATENVQEIFEKTIKEDRKLSKQSLSHLILISLLHNKEILKNIICTYPDFFRSHDVIEPLAIHIKNTKTIQSFYELFLSEKDEVRSIIQGISSLIESNDNFVMKKCETTNQPLMTVSYIGIEMQVTTCDISLTTFHTIQRIDNNGNIGVFDKSGVIKGFFTLPKTPDTNIHIKNIDELLYQDPLLFGVQENATELLNTYCAQQKDIAAIFHNETGLTLENISFAEQVYIVRYISTLLRNKDTESLNTFFHFVHEHTEAGLKLFTLLHYDEAVSNDILELGTFMPYEDIHELFSLCNNIVIQAEKTTDAYFEIYQNIHEDKLDPVLKGDIIKQTLQKAIFLIKETYQEAIGEQNKTQNANHKNLHAEIIKNLSPQQKKTFYTRCSTKIQREIIRFKKEQISHQKILDELYVLHAKFSHEKREYLDELHSKSYQIIKEKYQIKLKEKLKEIMFGQILTIDETFFEDIKKELIETPTQLQKNKILPVGISSKPHMQKTDKTFDMYTYMLFVHNQCETPQMTVVWFQIFNYVATYSSSQLTEIIRNHTTDVEATIQSEVESITKNKTLSFLCEQFPHISIEHFALARACARFVGQRDIDFYTSIAEAHNLNISVKDFESLETSEEYTQNFIETIFKTHQEYTLFENAAKNLTEPTVLQKALVNKPEGISDQDIHSFCKFYGMMEAAMIASMHTSPTWNSVKMGHKKEVKYDIFTQLCLGFKHLEANKAIYDYIHSTTTEDQKQTHAGKIINSLFYTLYSKPICETNKVINKLKPLKQGLKKEKKIDNEKYSTLRQKIETCREEVDRIIKAFNVIEITLEEENNDFVEFAQTKNKDIENLSEEGHDVLQLQYYKSQITHIEKRAKELMKALEKRENTAFHSFRKELKMIPEKTKKTSLEKDFNELKNIFGKNIETLFEQTPILHFDYPEIESTSFGWEVSDDGSCQEYMGFKEPYSTAGGEDELIARLSNNQLSGSKHEFSGVNLSLMSQKAQTRYIQKNLKGTIIDFYRATTNSPEQAATAFDRDFNSDSITDVIDLQQKIYDIIVEPADTLFQQKRSQL